MQMSWPLYKRFSFSLICNILFHIYHERFSLMFLRYFRLQTPEGTSYNGLYGNAPPKRGIFFVLEVYERVGIPRVEVQKRIRKTVIYIFKRV